MRKMYSKKQIENMASETTIESIKSVSEGTIAEAIGLDEDGNIVKGQAGGGGGSSKYAHFIKFFNFGYNNYFVALIICDKSEAFTLETLGQWLYQNGYTSSSNVFSSIFSGNGSKTSAYPSIDCVVGIFSESDDSQNVKAYIREDRFTTDGSSISITTTTSSTKILSLGFDSVVEL